MKTGNLTQRRKGRGETQRREERHRKPLLSELATRIFRLSPSKVFAALLCGLCVSALIPRAMGQTNTPAGALVTFAITNSDATPYNGPLWVYSVGPGSKPSAILADGSFFITGITKRIEVTNALGSLRLMRGTYFASNSVMAYCLAVPLDSGTNNAAALKVGGYNIFEYVPGVTSDVASNIAQEIGR